MDDLEKVCRFCMQPPTSEFSVNIFRDENGESFAREVKDVVPFELKDLPDWPRSACLDCIEFLQQYLKFRKLMVVSNKKLGREIERQRSKPKQKQIKAKDPIEVRPPPAQPWTISTVLQEENAAPHLPIIEISHPPLEQLEESQQELIVESDQWDSFADIIVYDGGGGDIDEEEIAVESMPVQILDVPVVIPPVPKKPEVSARPPRPVLQAKSPVASLPSMNSPRNPASIIRATTTPSAEEIKLEKLMLKRKWFVCRLCNVDAGSFFDLNRHIRLLHPGVKYDICCRQSIMSSPLALYDHMRLHVNRDRFACKECKSFRGTSSVELAEHMQLRHKQKTIDCKLCPKKLIGTSAYWNHIKQVHKDSLIMQCEQCHMEFNCPDQLYLHTMRHKKQPPRIDDDEAGRKRKRAES